MGIISLCVQQPLIYQRLYLISIFDIFLKLPVLFPVPVPVLGIEFLVTYCINNSFPERCCLRNGGHIYETAKF